MTVIGLVRQKNQSYEGNMTNWLINGQQTVIIRKKTALPLSALLYLKLHSVQW